MRSLAKRGRKLPRWIAVEDSIIYVAAIIVAVMVAASIVYAIMK